MTLTHPVPARDVKTRRINFEYSLENMPKHYARDGDLVMSHVVAMLSAMFPNGEDFFVQSVRNVRDQITDPELKKQVGGFIGQEAIHGREHRVLNEKLAELGYKTRWVDRNVGRWFKGFGGRFYPQDIQLAITAALEHYTATLAYVLLAKPEAREMIEDPEVRHLFMWHALEESEHKAVAFDVFQAVSGNQRLRTRVMNIVTLDFLLFSVLTTVVSLVADPDSRNLRTLWRSLRRLPSSPWLSKDVRRHIRDYNRRDFHPDDHDTSELLEYWRNELFGDAGTLNDHLKAAS